MRGSPIDCTLRDIHRSQSDGGAGVDHAEECLANEHWLAQRDIETEPRWRRQFREAWHAAKFKMKFPYWRFIYRHHMRLIHPRWHWWTHLHPIGGPAQDWCQWCGKRRVYCPDVVFDPSKMISK